MLILAMAMAIHSHIQLVLSCLRCLSKTKNSQIYKERNSRRGHKWNINRVKNYSNLSRAQKQPYRFSYIILFENRHPELTFCLQLDLHFVSLSLSKHPCCYALLSSLYQLITSIAIFIFAILLFIVPCFVLCLSFSVFFFALFDLQFSHSLAFS